MSKSLQERIDELLRTAEVGELFATASRQRVADAMLKELDRRGYEVEGKSADELNEVAKRPPTKQVKP